MDTFSAAVMLFLIMDPLGNLPVFLSILRHVDPKRRRKVMLRELLFSLVIMMGFLFAGQQILSFLNLRQEAVSIAGGIILFLIAEPNGLSAILDRIAARIGRTSGHG